MTGEVPLWFGLLLTAAVGLEVLTGVIGVWLILRNAR